KRLNANLLLPLIMPLALLAAYGAVWLWNRLGHARWIAVSLAVLLLVWPSYLSLRFTQLITTPDTRMQAQAWIYQHIPKGTDIHLLGSYNVPLDPLDYVTQQTYSSGIGVKPDDPLWNSSVIVYSDSAAYAVMRDSRLTENVDDIKYTEDVALR